MFNQQRWKNLKRCHHAAHAYTGVPCSKYRRRRARRDHQAQDGVLPRLAGGGAAKSGRLRSFNPKDPVTLQLKHGGGSQAIRLPTDKLEQNKKYYVRCHTNAKHILNYDQLQLVQFGFFKIISIFQLHAKTSTWRSGQRRRNPFWTARTAAESFLSALLRFQTSLLVSLIFHPILFSCLWFCPPVLRFPLLSWISPSFLCTPPISLIPHFLHFLSDFWLEQPTPKSFQIPIEVSTKTAFVSEFKFQHHLCQPATKRTQNNGFMLLKSKILSSVQFVEEIKIIFSWLSRFDERLEIKVCSKSEI